MVVCFGWVGFFLFFFLGMEQQKGAWDQYSTHIPTNDRLGRMAHILLSHMSCIGCSLLMQMPDASQAQIEWSLGFVPV